MKKIIAMLLAVLMLCSSATASAASYSKYTVKVTGNKKCPRTVTVTTNGRKRTYRIYNQTAFDSSYLSQRGCAHTAAAIVMSAYGKKYVPPDIHYGSMSKKCSERYALKKLGKKVAVSGQSLSIYSISQILKNTGIKNHAVYKFTNAKATKEITANLQAGRPVIIMCSRKKVNGIRLANSYHMLVLAGIGKKGNAIVLNPANGSVNRSHCTGAFKLTVSKLVKNHMWSCTGSKYKSFYFNGAENYGGYIVIDE